jgi:hypothetical protein
MFRAVNDLTMSDVRVNEIIGHPPCVATRTSTDNNKHCTKVVASPPPLQVLHTSFYTSRTPTTECRNTTHRPVRSPTLMRNRTTRRSLGWDLGEP